MCPTSLNNFLMPALFLLWCRVVLQRLALRSAQYSMPSERTDGGVACVAASVVHSTRRALFQHPFRRWYSDSSHPAISFRHRYVRRRRTCTLAIVIFSQFCRSALFRVFWFNKTGGHRCGEAQQHSRCVGVEHRWLGVALTFRHCRDS